MRFKLCILLVLSALLLYGCGGKESVPSSEQDIFIPPTLSQSELQRLFSESDAAPTLTDEPIRPTPTPTCFNGLRFLSDLTIPDGTLVEPGETLDKRWEVENSGTCNWDDRYRVGLIAGPGMGVPVQQTLVPALAGTQTMIRMVFIAPKEEGNYRSAWQAYDPDGNAFGDPFFIDVIVGEEE